MSERTASKTRSDVAWMSRPEPSMCQRTLPLLSKSVFAADHRQPRDRATVSTSESRDIAKDTGQLIVYNRRDLADLLRDYNAASIPRENPGTRVYGFLVYENRSCAS